MKKNQVSIWTIIIIFLIVMGGIYALMYSFPKETAIVMAILISAAIGFVVVVIIKKSGMSTLEIVLIFLLFLMGAYYILPAPAISEQEESSSTTFQADPDSEFEVVDSEDISTEVSMFPLLVGIVTSSPSIMFSIMIGAILIFFAGFFVRGMANK